MKIQIGRLQETILEIVEVKKNTIHIKFRLRIAIGPVQSASTTQLDIRQLTDCLLQKFLLFLIISTSCFTTTLDRIKKRSST